jgi:hypothetical protein
MNRLQPAAVAELIDRYGAGAPANELARQFGVHRHKVAALLQRHGVGLRTVGISEDQVIDAPRLFREGWSLARLGDKFGVADMTVRRYLLLAGVVMRSPNERTVHRSRRI